MTWFVIRGLEVFKLDGGKGQDHQEIDILLVDYDRQIIFNIEAKSWLGGKFAEKAAIQLERIRTIITDYFDSELQDQWRFVSAVSCISAEDEIKNCPIASKFVFSREDQDFLEKFHNIMSDATTKQPKKPKKSKKLWYLNQKHPEDFSMITRNLTYLVSKIELPTTNHIHAEIKKKLDEAGSVENIKFLAFPTPQQQGLIKACDHPGYKMAFIGAWGTGKTMLL